ncbi:MAG: hypothetical protein QOE70_1125 [Chthoniobacter sp.]|jgi:hypothetical protein|nr:hypothetical protein [Chthoniobacter sp.]
MKTMANLIFRKLTAPTGERKAPQRQRWSNALAVCAYCAFGFWIFADTGFAPWNWQFSTVFVPLFIASELAWRIMEEDFRPAAE